ncbi:rhomboid family intramembrane serine protease, partial [candidate division KSB1 bacterium]
MYTYYQTSRFGIGGELTPVVKNLIAINILVYMAQMVSPVFYDFMVGYFGLWPYKLIHNFFIWQLVSYMFMHGGILHILMNMLFLWMFGSPVEKEWGSKEFLKFYFVSGIGAGVINVIFQPNIPNLSIVGASGAIYGVMVAFAVMFPERRIWFIPARFFVLYMGILAFLAAFSTHRDNVAHFAHLGGFVVGYLYLQYKVTFEKA